MIVTEKIKINGRTLVRTYSDEGYYILQKETGIEYAEAVDIENAPYTYEETNKKIDALEESEEADEKNEIEEN